MTIGNQGKTTALLTDRYELTMVDAALGSGQANKRAVFEVFTRSLPPSRAYGVVAGTSRAIDAIANFRFGDAELEWLANNDVISPAAIDYLGGYSFTGDVWGFAEGDLYLANSPVLTVEATFAEAVVLETVLLSIFNHDSAVASAVARMVEAADGRALIEGGARRAHESAAVSAARAAYLAGATATSNLEAGRTYNIPTVGTIGHAFVLAHETEAEAFAAQHRLLGSETTYLIDTYDIENGIRSAVATAGPKLGGIRIDSGELGFESRRAREVLNGLGAHDANIIVSGDLDEWSIAALAEDPIDGYLVGTNLITGSGHPTASMVYKLVAMQTKNGWDSVNKQSIGKGTVGGRKTAFRLTDHDQLIVDNERPLGDVEGPGRRLQVPLIEQGQIIDQPTLEASREWCRRCRTELPTAARQPDAVALESRLANA